MRAPQVHRVTLCVLAAAALSCAQGAGGPVLAAATEHAGTVATVATATLPPEHPSVPVADPASSNDHSGRAPRRLNVDQLRASLLAVTGFTWSARRTVSDPDSPTGYTTLPDADMLEALAATLGRADYYTSTTSSISPAVTFAKLSNDAARSACRASVTADVAQTDPTQRHILRTVNPADTLATNQAGVRGNLSALALRFWGRQLDPADAQLDPLERLFTAASTAAAGPDRSGTMRPAGTPADGWRAVCIAMATDTQFLTF